MLRERLVGVDRFRGLGVECTEDFFATVFRETARTALGLELLDLELRFMMDDDLSPERGCSRTHKMR